MQLCNNKKSKRALTLSFRDQTSGILITKLDRSR